MKSIKALWTAKGTPASLVVDVRQTVQRVLTEYVLNMAVTCLAHGDLGPLCEDDSRDPRLSKDDKEELARAYVLLQVSSVQRSDPSRP